MEEKITLLPIKRYVIGGCKIIPLIWIVFIAYYTLGYSINNLCMFFISISLFCFISFCFCIVQHKIYEKYYPLHIKSDESSLQISGSDESQFHWYWGFQERYLLSECVWWKGYSDTLSIIPWGVLLSPIHIKRAIIVYHVPTSQMIALGVSSESKYHQWIKTLEKSGCREYRNRSRFEPAIVFLSLLLGLVADYFLIKFPMDASIKMVLCALIPIALTTGGRMISGSDILFIDFKKILIGIILLLLFFACLSYNHFL